MVQVTQLENTGAGPESSQQGSSIHIRGEKGPSNLRGGRRNFGEEVA